jgi:hypothetical protein
MNYKALIIGVLLGGFAIVGVSIYAGVVARDVEVEDNAYEAGLRYDSVNKREAELGWRVELPRNIKSGAGILDVKVLDAKGATVTDAVVNLRLHRMGDPRVRSYRCAAGEGRYTVAVNLDSPGYWEAMVRVDRQDDSQHFNNTFFVQ